MNISLPIFGKKFDFVVTIVLPCNSLQNVYNTLIFSQTTNQMENLILPTSYQLNSDIQSDLPHRRNAIGFKLFTIKNRNKCHYLVGRGLISY